MLIGAAAVLDSRNRGGISAGIKHRTKRVFGTKCLIMLTPLRRSRSLGWAGKLFATLHVAAQPRVAVLQRTRPPGYLTLGCSLGVCCLRINPHKEPATP